MAIDYTMIGKRLKESRMAAKLTQEKVAEAADITTVYLSKIENGKVTPTPDNLGAGCAAGSNPSSRSLHTPSMVVPPGGSTPRA